MSKLLTVYDDYEPLNNVVCALTLDVDEVFYLYHHEEQRMAFTNIRKVIGRYKNIALHFVRPEDDVKEITRILLKNEDIIIDVGGSKYLSLLLFEYANRADKKIVYFDSEENVIKDYRSHSIIDKPVFKLTITDVLNLRGGKITQQSHKNATDPKTIETIYNLFESNLDNYSALTAFMSNLGKKISGGMKIGSKTFRLRKEQIAEIRKDPFYDKTEDLFTIEGSNIIFKTPQLIDTVKVSGSILENYIYLKLKESGQFDDVKMSVMVDFSNDWCDHPVTCEIDLLAIKDNCLLFISCKSNKVETPALNEIYVHNSMFGNALSIPIICVCEELDRSRPSIYAKAEELGIYMIDRSNLIEEDFPEIFHEIVSGVYEYDLL